MAMIEQKVQQPPPPAISSLPPRTPAHTHATQLKPSQRTTTLKACLHEPGGQPAEEHACDVTAPVFSVNASQFALFRSPCPCCHLSALLVGVSFRVWCPKRKSTLFALSRPHLCFSLLAPYSTPCLFILPRARHVLGRDTAAPRADGVT